MPEGYFFYSPLHGCAVYAKEIVTHFVKFPWKFPDYCEKSHYHEPTTCLYRREHLKNCENPWKLPKIMENHVHLKISTTFVAFLVGFFMEFQIFCHFWRVFVDKDQGHQHGGTGSYFTKLTVIWPWNKHAPTQFMTKLRYEKYRSQLKSKSTKMLAVRFNTLRNTRITLILA